MTKARRNGVEDPEAVEENAAAERSGRSVKLDLATQARIGDRLRAMYGELLEQPVPERFRSLLAQLDGAPPEHPPEHGADKSDGDREASR
ncbi:MAG: hypothetical protein EA385_14815 [Salinarimonadaceae bacterium]|nr:MAG: hypothetical protein EA385_14815 [Salinarimonadaceae bacterium]